MSSNYSRSTADPDTQDWARVRLLVVMARVCVSVCVLCCRPSQLLITSEPPQLHVDVGRHLPPHLCVSPHFFIFTTPHPSISFSLSLSDGGTLSVSVVTVHLLLEK